MKKIKIFHIITSLGIGGAERMLANLVRTTNQERFEVTVISLLSKKEHGYSIDAQEVKVVYLNTKGILGIFQTFATLIKMMRKERPDIIHTHLFHADMFGRIAARIARVPIVVSTIQNVSVGGILRETLLRLTRSMVRWHTAVAHIVERYALRSGIARKGAVSVIYNSVDLSDFSPLAKIASRYKLGIPSDAIVLVSVGRLEKQKGYPYLIKALPLLPHNANRVLYILGEGKERKELQMQINSIPSKVHMLGSVPNVREYIAVADIFVMPSLWEGFSLALLEAAAMGLPIIATDVGGNGELIENGKSGILVAPKDPRALADAIALVSGHKEKSKKMGKAARQKAVASFSLTAMTQVYEALYEILLGKDNTRK